MEAALQYNTKIFPFIEYKTNTKENMFKHTYLDFRDAVSRKLCTCRNIPVVANPKLILL